jgi:hypothetical protein
MGEGGGVLWSLITLSWSMFTIEQWTFLNCFGRVSKAISLDAEALGFESRRVIEKWGIVPQSQGCGCTLID